MVSIAHGPHVLIRVQLDDSQLACRPVSLPVLTSQSPRAAQMENPLSTLDEITHLLSRKRRGAVATPLQPVLQTTHHAGFAELAQRGGCTEKAHHGNLVVEFMSPC